MAKQTQGWEEQNDKIVVIKHFFSESEARLYAARLKEVDIPSFISNANIMTALPLGGGGGIGLNVREKDAGQAQRIVAQLDLQRQQNLNDDYREVDEEEIAYLKSLHERQSGKQKWNMVLWLVVIIALLLVLRAFLRAAGIVESWWDFF